MYPAGMSAPPTLSELRAKRDEILRTAATYGATNIRVFGSVARGDAREDSDVDFLVDVSPEHRGFDFFGVLDEIRQDLEEIVGRRVDVISIRGPSSPDGTEMTATIEREMRSL